ncbi:Hypothetical protein Bdt_0938 [Bdellovibrio bacteriovorus str. Tiberius]|uniref:Uncharacterized protein n=1 Tax=Bdellovibrio bacteriovorus str. Tiberius TaxID=1069642 RepID=K7YSM7_BDEBC|nr:Hypothetical protein Bdt_0938 [Bdellovibrio bacteriovorus str. Tiberius]
MVAVANHAVGGGLSFIAGHGSCKCRRVYKGHTGNYEKGNDLYFHYSHFIWEVLNLKNSLFFSSTFSEYVFRILAQSPAHDVSYTETLIAVNCSSFNLWTPFRAQTP